MRRPNRQRPGEPAHGRSWPLSLPRCHKRSDQSPLRVPIGRNAAHSGELVTGSQGRPPAFRNGYRGREAAANKVRNSRPSAAPHSKQQHRAPSNRDHDPQRTERAPAPTGRRARARPPVAACHQVKRPPSSAQTAERRIEEKAGGAFRSHTTHRRLSNVEHRRPTSFRTASN